MNQSLFARLGGTSGIFALVEDVVALHMQNPVIGARFRPYLDTPAIDDILLALRKCSIDEQSQKDVLAIAHSLKGDILHI